MIIHEFLIVALLVIVGLLNCALYLYYRDRLHIEDHDQ